MYNDVSQLILASFKHYRYRKLKCTKIYYVHIYIICFNSMQNLIKLLWISYIEMFGNSDVAVRFDWSTCHDNLGKSAYTLVDDK